MFEDEQPEFNSDDNHVSTYLKPTIVVFTEDGRRGNFTAMQDADENDLANLKNYFFSTIERVQGAILTQLHGYADFGNGKKIIGICHPDCLFHYRR